MSPEKQRIAIAEARGWNFNPPPYNKPPFSAEFKSEALLCWIRPGNLPHQLEYPPDYLNDRNAIHDAVASLKPEQRFTFIRHLGRVLSRQHEDFNDSEFRFDFLRVIAKPEWLCEAYIRTIGKWEVGE